MKFTYDKDVDAGYIKMNDNPIVKDLPINDYCIANVVVVMYLEDADEQPAAFEKEGLLPTSLSLGLTAILVLVLGIIPSFLINWSLGWAITLF